MIIKKNNEQIKGIREAGRIVAEAIAGMAEIVKPGITAKELENAAKKIFEKNNAQSACLGYRPGRGMSPYPGFVCISINDEIVHGIPGSKVIDYGDLVSVDVSSKYNGFIGDGASTFVMDGASQEAKKLAWTTYRALHKGIETAKVGNKISDISRVVQTYAESKGYSIVRDLAGHGVGIQLHEEPQVPNFVDKSLPDVFIMSGMTIAIEPMVCEKSYRIIVNPDGWTIRTADGGLSSHSEHSIAITDEGTNILTLLADGSEAYIPPEA
ncbi:type I methionyl aminopeptidase [bacterium]|nr:type I methionyl aminopeptidase [bacterium]